VQEDREVTKLVKRVTLELFLYFLKSVDLKNVEPNLEDPLYQARMFLLDQGVEVPKTYVGNYEKYMLEGWKRLYQTSPHFFQEIKDKHKITGEMVDCLKIKISLVGHLVPLSQFENNNPYDREHYYLLKKEFFSAIGVKDNEGLFNKFKRIVLRK
jgi:hypothetical protein